MYLTQELLPQLCAASALLVSIVLTLSCGALQRVLVATDCASGWVEYDSDADACAYYVPANAALLSFVLGMLALHMLRTCPLENERSGV